MAQPFQFNRTELAGSLGDLGALLPLTIGMIMVNGMSITGTFYSIALFYIIGGAYYRVPIPVQPMKVIAAYAIATGMTSSQISAASGLVCIFLLIIGLTSAIDAISRFISKAVIRGVQLSTGILLMSQGLKLIMGNSTLQLAGNIAEPNLTLQAIGPIPIGLVLGILSTVIILFFLKSKKYPAAIFVILLGLLTGLIWGTHTDFDLIRPGFYLPALLPFGTPEVADLTVALFVVVLPQLPMTVGNAVIASTDLSKEYFGEDAKKVTYKASTLSMGLANGLSFLLGGIPLCHGTGGLAAHYNFGARTGGSNVIIGGIFLLLAFFFGPHILPIIKLLPLSVLGILLVFAGMYLGLTILDMFARKDMFVVLLILAITLTANLAWAVLAGIILSKILQSDKFSI